MTSAILDEAVETRIQGMTAQIFILEAVKKLLGEATRAEDYPVVRSELVRLKSRCDSLVH